VLHFIVYNVDSRTPSHQCISNVNAISAEFPKKMDQNIYLLKLFVNSKLTLLPEDKTLTKFHEHCTLSYYTGLNIKFQLRPVMKG